MGTILNSITALSKMSDLLQQNINLIYPFLSTIDYDCSRFFTMTVSVVLVSDSIFGWSYC